TLTLSLAEEKRLARRHVTGRLGIERRLVERPQPARQFLKLALRQIVEGGHAALCTAFYQVMDLRLGHGTQGDVVDQRWRPVAAGPAFAMAAGAGCVELLLGRGEIRRCL